MIKTGMFLKRHQQILRTNSRVFSQSQRPEIKIHQTKLLIDNKFVNSVSGKTFDVIDPSTEKVVASVQEAGPEDIDLAVNAARRAFDEGPWRTKIGGTDRGKMINKLADLIEKNTHELAALESLNNGQPLFISYFVI